MHVLVLNRRDELVHNLAGYGYVICGDFGTSRKTRKEALPSHAEPVEGSVEAFTQTTVESWYKSVEPGMDALEVDPSDDGIVIAGQTAE